MTSKNIFNVCQIWWLVFEIKSVLNICLLNINLSLNNHHLLQFSSFSPLIVISTFLIVITILQIVFMILILYILILINETYKCFFSFWLNSCFILFSASWTSSEIQQYAWRITFHSRSWHSYPWSVPSIFSSSFLSICVLSYLKT